MRGEDIAVAVNLDVKRGKGARFAVGVHDQIVNAKHLGVLCHHCLNGVDHLLGGRFAEDRIFRFIKDLKTRSDDHERHGKTDNGVDVHTDRFG